MKFIALKNEVVAQLTKQNQQLAQQNDLLNKANQELLTSQETLTKQYNSQQNQIQSLIVGVEKQN